MKIKFPWQKQTQQRHHAHAQQLREHCNQAWSYIKKNPGGKLFGISPRPWILLLGTENSGKTSVLRGTSLSLSSPQKASLDKVKSTKLVDWWVDEKAIFIDPSSDIALPNNSIESARWETLLDIIQRYRMIRALHHIILVIDFPKLLKLDKNTLDELSKQLQSVQERTKFIPVSIVISKFDQMKGFTEMFDDLSADERKQALGLQFTPADRKNGITTAFENRFEILVQHLKTRLLTRMHHEQSVEKRKEIFAFPAEFSELEKPLETLITTLPFNSTIPLHGIHFTAVDDHRAYFTDGMIQAALTTSKQSLPVTSKYATERLLAFPIAAAIIFGFTVLWHAGYDQTIRIIDKTQEQLAATPTNIPNDMPWLSDLNRLSNVLETIRDKQTIRYQWVGLLQTHQLKSSTKKGYQQLLQMQFLPYLKSTLLTQIQLGMKDNKLALFDALKAYLTLSKSEHYNKDLIMSWYRTYWKALYPTDLDMQAKLQHHLFVLLESDKPLWQPDPALVQDAQAVLQKLSLTDLAFLELQGEYPPTNVPIFSNGLEGISLKNATVPSFFSTAHFKEIFNNKIPNIKNILSKGNWVLKTTKGRVITKKQQAEIAKKIQAMYLQYYTNVWAGTVSEIHLKPANNFSDVLQRIHSVLDDDSGLSQLLKVVVGNANLGKGATNKSLTAVKALMNKKGRYNNIKQALTALQEEIQSIQKADNTGKASYLKAISRFKCNGIGDPIGQVYAEANRNPEPIRSWLTTIANSTWKAMLMHTHTYLNNVWQTVVLPVYHNEIENRYPVFPSSRENISLKNFNDFFGPNGTIGAFFIYYLQPFVNMTQNYWTWKSLNGISLNIPQKVLNTFIRASIIQQMFFTDNHNKPSFRFVLSPLTLSGTAKKFTLNVGGQIYNIYQRTRRTKRFYWPGPDPSFVSAQFITTSGNNPTMTYNGPWSWFRMLDANTLQSSANPEVFTLTIQSGNSSVSLKVTAEHRVNPMVPGVIAKYRCPENF